MTDERYKKLMEDVGMPDSRSLFIALHMVANEVAQECNAELKIAVQALNDVIDPISKMNRELEEGYRLDGQMAHKLSQDPNYLREIAKTALDKLEN